MLKTHVVPPMPEGVQKRISALNGGVAAALVCATALLGIPGCAAGPWRWRAPHGLENPLVGSIWSVTEGAFVSEATLDDALVDSRFVLLGERHDNPDHHGLQARVIRALAERDCQPVVVMEMLDLDDSEAIDDCRRSYRCSSRKLATAVRWQDSGWPDWHLYKPVLDAALKAGLAIAPASLPVAKVRAFARTGKLDGDEDAILLRRLGLDRPLDPPTREAMAAEIRASHCGHVPEQMVDGMVAAQRLRDAHMAESLLMASPMGRAVLVAGSGHARTDRELAKRLQELAPGARVASVAFVEVDPELTDPRAYAKGYGAPVLPFDYAWFTPSIDDTDPCVKFREQLHRISR